MNFVICDDVHALAIKKVLEPMIIRKKLGNIVLTATEPQPVLDYINKNTNITAYFIDINLNSSINGIGLAKIIREKDIFSYIIFVTAHAELSQSNYRYKICALDYLIKPIMPYLFEECVNFIEKYEKLRQLKNDLLLSNPNKCISIKSGCELIRLNVYDIVYIEVNTNKITIHTKNKTIMSFQSLKGIFYNIKNMKIDNFLFCHKSYIINAYKVKAICKNSILMENNDECPLSRTYKKAIMEYFK